MRFKIKNNVDKLGTAGLFLTAVVSPCCFPIFAFVGAALGLGSLELLGGWTMLIFQAMVEHFLVVYHDHLRMRVNKLLHHVSMQVQISYLNHLH